VMMRSLEYTNGVHLHLPQGLDGCQNPRFPDSKWRNVIRQTLRPQDDGPDFGQRYGNRMRPHVINKISLSPLSVAFGRSANPFGNSACAARIVSGDSRNSLILP